MGVDDWNRFNQHVVSNCNCNVGWGNVHVVSKDDGFMDRNERWL